MCPGVNDPDFPTLVDFLGSGSDQRYYQHVMYQTIDDNVVHTSTVRSSMCKLLTEDGMCLHCKYTKTLLKAKADRAAQVAKTLYRNTGCCTMCQPKH